MYRKGPFEPTAFNPLEPMAAGSAQPFFSS